MKEKSNLMLVAIIGIILLGIVGFFFLGGQDEEDSDQDVPVNAVDLPEERVDENMNESEPVDMRQNIVDIASADERFTTLVSAIVEADLVDVLAGDGPYTVFAPTNEAFAKIPEEALQDILADKDQLTAILTYHVVPGKVMASDVVNVTSATTVQGGDLSVEVMGGNVMINNAQILITDIEASNGVIHVIDTVLVPQ